MLQLKQKIRKNKQMTVLPGMLSVMRLFSLWEVKDNEKFA